MTRDTNPSHFQPSTELNQAFTPLISAFMQKLQRHKWQFPIMPRDIEASMQIGPVSQGVPFEYDNPHLFIAAKETAFVHWNGLYFKAPVGEYGLEWGKRLVLAGVTLANTIANPALPVHVLDEAAEVNKRYDSTLIPYTFRKISRVSLPVEADEINGPPGSLKEAFQSTLFAIGFLTAYKVPGYENSPEKLLHDLVAEGVVSQLALIISPRATARMGIEGALFLNPTVVRGGDGKLALNKEIVHHFHENLQPGGRYERHKTGAWEKLERHGCPVARVLPGNDTSGVDMAAQIFEDCLMVQKKHTNLSNIGRRLAL